MVLNDSVEFDLPQLSGLIDDACTLDMGKNTRGLIKSQLLWMLATFDFITPAAVREFKGCSERHAYRIAGCLRVIVQAFAMQAEGKLPDGAEGWNPKNKTKVKKRVTRAKGKVIHKP